MTRQLERTATRSCAWGVPAAIALLWPARLASPIDGIPLDQALEAVLIGLVFPALWWFFPEFLRRTTVRALILALIVWKGLLAATTTGDGWCIRFNPPPPIAKDAPGAPHSWDLRADWRSPDPACSAIVTRQYESIGDFSAWFFNLPPPSDSYPGPTDRPPGAATPTTLTGYLRANEPGVLTVEVGKDIDAALAIDGREAARGRGRLVAQLPTGVHSVDLTATLTGDAWRLNATWNGRDLWTQSIATLHRPSTFDRIVRPWGRWIAPLIALALVLPWLAYAIRQIDLNLLTWTVAAGGWFGILAAFGHDEIVRWSVPFLAAAACVPIQRRWRNATGLFFLIGIPWLIMLAGLSFDQIGRWHLYDVGSDPWTFQRAAYRIVMLGYWLEGGSLAFWFQPLYRWVSGLLHVVFGDSSVGEVWWDAAWILVSATFAFQIARRARGYTWGVVAAVLTLALFALANPRQHIGTGLSEITSAGLLSLAAMLAMRSRHREWRFALAAGVLASLAFYTRLNNLPMAFATALFALPLAVPASALLRPATWIRRVSWITVACIAGCTIVAVLLFAWRTYHYTGVFSVTYGTQVQLLAVWKPGMTRVQGAHAMGSSVMMVLTMNDPPRIDAYAVPLVAGAATALLAVVGVPVFRTIPLAPALFCLAGLAGALVARGSAYEGRFSVHVIPVASAVLVCAIAGLVPGLPSKDVASSSEI